MLSCEDCKNRAIAESQKLRQVDGEPARDFYIRILNHFRIWDRLYFGLRRENLGVALDASLNDLSIDEIINIISQPQKKLRLVSRQIFEYKMFHLEMDVLCSEHTPSLIVT